MMNFVQMIIIHNDYSGDPFLLDTLNFNIKGRELPQRLIDMGVVSVNGSKPLFYAVETIDGEPLTEERWRAVDEWLNEIRDESNQ